MTSRAKFTESVNVVGWIERQRYEVLRDLVAINRVICWVADVEKIGEMAARGNDANVSYSRARSLIFNW